MKFQRCLSCIVLYKEKMENNMLKRLPRQISYCRWTSFVGVLPFFGRFGAAFDCISDSDDI